VANGNAAWRRRMPSAECECRVPNANAECRMRMRSAERECRVPNANDAECRTRVPNANAGCGLANAGCGLANAGCGLRMATRSRHSRSTFGTATDIRHSHSSFPFGIPIRHSHSTFEQSQSATAIRKIGIRHSAVGSRLGPGHRFIRPYCRGVRLGQKRGDLPTKLVLDDLDLPPCIEHAESEFVRH
jgi:hypothetical protein